MVIDKQTRKTRKRWITDGKQQFHEGLHTLSRMVTNKLERHHVVYRVSYTNKH